MIPTRHQATIFAPVLATVAVLATLALASLQVGCRREPRAENLVLVTIDTLRRDHVGIYGAGTKAETPYLDALAQAGVRFDQASAAAPLTLVSHATILSGLWPPHHGLRQNGAGRWDAAKTTLASHLAAQGYQTAAFASAFVLDRRFGLDHGFELYDVEIPRAEGARPALEAERRGDATIDRAIRWLTETRRDDGGSNASNNRPFFLWVHLYDPHAPYSPPSPYGERFAGREYEGEVAFVDAQLGRLLAAVEQAGVARSTAVAVTADHGEGLGEHGESTHGLLLYESTLAVPLVIRAPKIPAGSQLATPTSLADLAPTLAGLVGHPFSTPTDGKDLSEALQRGAEPPSRDVYAETRYPEIFGWSPLSALRRRQMKYIESSSPELYDLANDSKETKNLAAESGAPTRGFAEQLASMERSAVAPAAETTAVDEETRKRLASLGYVASASPRSVGATHASPLPNPRDRIQLFQRFEQAFGKLSRGETAEAARELAALAAEDPKNPSFRAKLARALRDAGQLEQALPLYRQTAVESPRDPDAWYELATALRDTGRLDAARSAAEQALSLDDRRSDAQNLVGLVHLAAGRLEEAARAFARAAEIDPQDGTAHNNLGNALRALGRSDEAEHAYQRSIAVAPRYADPWNGLGAIAVERDRPQDALASFEKAITLAPSSLEARLNRGIALELLGNRVEAAAAYRDVLDRASGPEHAGERQAATQLLSRLGSIR